MKKIHLSIVSLFLFGFVFLVPDVAFAQDEEAQQPQDNIFLEFEPINLAIIRDNRVRGSLNVTYMLAVDSNDKLNHVETIRPRLRDSMIRHLARLAKTRVDPRLPVDVVLISKVMQEGADETLGEGYAEVLVQSAAAQPRH